MKSWMSDTPEDVATEEPLCHTALQRLLFSGTKQFVFDNCLTTNSQEVVFCILFQWLVLAAVQMTEADLSYWLYIDFIH